jgi:arsenate reductase
MIERIDRFELIDIKEHHITAEALDFIRRHVDTYESLFNKRARKFSGLAINPEQITEDKWRDLILSEHTFLKRPVIIYGDKVYVGNSKKVVEEALASINQE